MLSSLIGDNQSAFIKGRNIQNNILLMHEIVKDYKRTGGPKSCAIKVEIMKAFDTLRWDYLFTILDHMNFPDKYIKWVKLCVTTASFSINLNGALTGRFSSSRGLRQGDPLSPCLFIIAMEGFNQLLKQKIRQQIFHYHPRCEKLELTSLAFADDLFILCKADTQSVIVVKEILEEFQSLQALNQTKKSVKSSPLGSTRSKRKSSKTL